MTTAWPKVRLKEVLNPINRGEVVDSVREYRLLGVRLDGQGPFLRETVLGSQTAASKLYRVNIGDFIYSRLFACRGAFGIISVDLDGCYVSGEFPTFLPVDTKIDVKYLRYWFRLADTLDRVNEDCTGSTPLTRNRFKEEFFLSLEISLPPLAEQRRIVARIEELAAKITEARSLHQEVVANEDALLVCMAHRRDLDEQTKLSNGWRKLSLHDCVHLVDDSHDVEAQKSYPNLGIYSYGRGIFPKPPIDGTLTAAKFLRRVRKGQFIYSRLFAFEGSYGMVLPEFDGYFVSSEYPTFECDPALVRAEFLWAYFRSSEVWKTVAVGSKGLGDRRQRVQPAQILSHTLWIPPITWQDRIAEVQAKVDALKRLQAETAAELNALLPSILDRAFKGEL